MDMFEAVMIAEDSGGVAETDEQQQAWQLLVDSGMAWSLQGWFGRRAMELIQAGIITPEGGGDVRA